MLSIAYIATDGPQKRKRERKLSEKEILHRLAVEAIASRRIRNMDRIKKMFAPELEELEELKLKRDRLKQMR